MQDNTTTTKDQDSKARRLNPIRIEETPRFGAPHADALREVHSSLVRAGQNLYNLVQANQGSNGVSHQAPQSAYPSFAFGQGFAPSAYSPAPAQSPYPSGFGATGQQAGFGTPAIAFPWSATPWATPQLMGAAWKSLTADIGAALGALQPIAIALGTLQQASTIPAPGPSALAFGRVPPAPSTACDILDEGKQFVCLVDMPGIKAAQVELVVSEQAFTIAAYRETDGDVATLLQAERGPAAFQRTVALPAAIQPASVKATLANGVLTIALPKVEPTEGPRRVKVQG